MPLAFGREGGEPYVTSVLVGRDSQVAVVTIALSCLGGGRFQERRSPTDKLWALFGTEKKRRIEFLALLEAIVYAHHAWLDLCWPGFMCVSFRRI